MARGNCKSKEKITEEGGWMKFTDDRKWIELLYFLLFYVLPVLIMVSVSIIAWIALLTMEEVSPAFLK